MSFIAIIETNQTGIVQTLGKFTRLIGPGFNMYIPFLQKVNRISNRLEQLEFSIPVKTKDDVFLDLDLKIQYQIKPEDTMKAYFSMTEPKQQFEAFIESTIRSTIPEMTMNQVFESQTTIKDTVNIQIGEKMSEYGFTIVNTLVTSIKPPTEVVHAMNSIKASERAREAAKNEAETNYILEIKKAQADRDRKILQGEGISGQRLAILKGYKEGISNLSQELGIEESIIMGFVMKTQELDAMTQVAISPNAKTLFFGNSGNNTCNEIVHNIVKAREV